jgi:hypothetical protein
VDFHLLDELVVPPAAGDIGKIFLGAAIFGANVDDAGERSDDRQDGGARSKPGSRHIPTSKK